MLRRWKHLKRGTTYVEDSRAIASSDIKEEDTVIVYTSEQDGRQWVREKDQFLDGRFEELEGADEYDSYQKVLESLNRANENLARAHKRIANLEYALTPSNDTKIAYSAEFIFDCIFIDDNGDYHDKKILVPWTTIKEIMAEILEFANEKKAVLK